MWTARYLSTGHICAGRKHIPKYCLIYACAYQQGLTELKAGTALHRSWIWRP